jgi:hypothetical protein
LRRRFVENVPSTFSELRDRVDINELLLEDVENMFWEELNVPVLEGTAHTEGKLFWRLLHEKRPDVAAGAVAFHAAHEDVKTQAEEARLQYRYACNMIFRPQFEDALIRTLVSLFDVSDYQYSAEATSPYMNLFRGHGEDELDARRMSVLESIPFEYLDDLGDRIDDLCVEYDLFDSDGEAVRVILDWKAAHRSVRNFVPKTPPEYAEEVFDICKEAVLDASYYLSISEVLVDARLAGIPLITCVF